VHISAVERAGLSTLNEGQKINYELASDRGKESAANLSLVNNVPQRFPSHYPSARDQRAGRSILTKKPQSRGTPGLPRSTERQFEDEPNRVFQ
jgi:hypothetical protein